MKQTNQTLRWMSALALATAMTSPAFAAEVVVVSAKSGISSLTADQVSQLFLGKTPALPDGSAAVLFDQTEGSAVRDAFYTKATGKNAAQMKALWSRLAFSGSSQPPKVLAGDAAVKKAVADTAGGIGYIDKGAVDSSVKVVFSLD